MHRGTEATRQEGGHLVGAVDGEVDDRVVVERGERDPERQGLLVGALGGGHADDLGELAVGEERADLGDGEGGRGARPEAQHHPSLHLLDRAHRREALEVVLRQRRRRLRGIRAHGEARRPARGGTPRGGRVEADGGGGGGHAWVAAGGGSSWSSVRGRMGSWWRRRRCAGVGAW